MGEYFLDFNDQNKSKARIIFGIVFVLLSIANGIITSLGANEVFGYLNTVLYFILGVFNIIDGSGSNLKNKLGKRFIKIDDKHALFKYNFFSDTISMDWENIKSISIKLSSLEFITIENQKEEISITRLNYAQKKEIKEFLNSLSNKLNLAVSQL